MNENAKRINRRASIKKNALQWLLLLPTTFTLIVCYIYPMVQGIIIAFFKTRGVEMVEFVGLENFRNVLSDTLFTQTLTNTIMYVVWSLIIGSLIPIVIAACLNEIIHGKETFKVLMYLPAIAPALAVSLIWVNIYSPNPSGLLNVVLSVMGKEAGTWLLNSSLVIPLIIISMTWKGYASSTLIYLSAMQSVNQDLYEAATLDGAGIWKKFFKVTVPHIAPTLLLMQVQQVIGVFMIIDQPMVMTDGGPNNASMSLDYSMFKTAFTFGQMDRAAAMGVIIFLCLIWVSVLYFWLDKKLKN